MTFSRRNLFTLLCSVALAMLAGQAYAAATVVKVSLWDKGAMSMSALGKGPEMGMAMGRGTAMTGAQMGLTLSTVTVPAGEVTFKVTNDSNVMVHEMIVAPLRNEQTPLPYLKKEMRVDEEAAGHLGEVAELQPGQGGALTLTMKPGRYILYCNMPGHYTLGMWKLITVR